MTFLRPFHRPALNKTKDLKKQNIYTELLLNDYSKYALTEDLPPNFKGQWREFIGVTHETPLDLEIGLGNGLHFAHRVETYPQRAIIGMELKYKPLIQSIRRALHSPHFKGKALRYHAFNIDLCFAPEEINDVFVYFPDPWTSPRKPENRILNQRTIPILFNLQRPGSTIYFKTDSQESFEWSYEIFKNSPYQIKFITKNLHNSEKASTNYITQFENIFIRKGLPIFALEAVKPL